MKATGYKECPSCKEIKPLSSYSKRGGKRLDYQHTCKPCRTIKLQEWRKNNPEADRALSDYHRLKKYGLTPLQYEKLLIEQEYTCKVCHKPDVAGRQLAVDHNHTTGKVRGLLCMNCNRGLGSVNEDKMILLSMIDYLSFYEEP